MAEDRKQVLNIFDFDGTLFKSPVPNFDLWEFSSYGQIVDKQPRGFGFFQNWRSLSPPFVPLHATLADFNQSIIQEAFRRSELAHQVNVVLTGRDESFRQRIEGLIADVGFVPDHIALKPSVDIVTLEFKIEYITKLLELYPDIEEVNIWDDRVKQVEGFRAFLGGLQAQGRIKAFDVRFFEGDRELTLEEEKSLIGLVIQDFERDFPEAQRTDIMEFIYYTCVALDSPCRKLLLEKFVLPEGWIQKADHLTISLGKARPDIMAQVGKIGSSVSFTAVSYGQSSFASAVGVEGLLSLNSRPHVTIGHDPKAKPKDSNGIPEADWRVLDEKIPLTGTVEYRKKLRLSQDGKLTIIEMRSTDIGRLIGKKGATIQQLRTESGIKIEIEDDDTSRGTRVVRLIGSPEARSFCVERIKSVCWSTVVVSSS